jgi:hypothetical protein
MAEASSLALSASRTMYSSSSRNYSMSPLFGFILISLPSSDYLHDGDVLLDAFFGPVGKLL